MITLKNNFLILKCYIKTQAHCNKILGVYNNRIKILINAIPVKNQANNALIDFFSEKFKVSKINVILKKGTLSYKKNFMIVQPKKIPLEIKKIFFDLNIFSIY